MNMRMLPLVLSSIICGLTFLALQPVLLTLWLLGANDPFNKVFDSFVDTLNWDK